MGRPPCRRKIILPEWVPAPNAILGTLKTMMGGPHLCSRRWIWEQYDHMVMGDTVQRPGGDAAVVRVHGTNKGLAITCDVTPRYVAADPVMGTKQAVVETLAQPDRRRRRSARHHRQHELRQPRAPRGHGPVRRRRPRHEGSLRGAQIPGRVGQRLALQRDQRRRPFRPRPPSAASGSIPDVARMADIAPEARGRPAGRRSAAKPATSASRSIS